MTTPLAIIATVLFWLDKIQTVRRLRAGRPEVNVIQRPLLTLARGPNGWWIAMNAALFIVIVLAGVFTYSKYGDEAAMEYCLVSSFFYGGVCVWNAVT